MSVYCPRDSQPCVDDLCQSGMCLVADEPAWERCDRCGYLFSGDVCDCPPDEDDDFDDHNYNAADGTEGSG